MKRGLHSLTVISATAAWLAAGPLWADLNPVIAAYFINWGIYDRDYQVTNIPAALITHVHYAFARPEYYADSNSAALVSLDPWADWEKPYPGDTNGQPVKGCFHQLARLKQRFPHLRTLIAAGGWTDSDDFSDICADGAARTAFVNSCAAFVTNFGFDGIDLDWEYPVSGGEDGLTHRPEDDDNFLQLAQDLRAKLDSQGAADGRAYLLTIAASADYSQATNRYRLADLAAVLDWIGVMTYDMAGPWDAQTAHQSPLCGNPAAPHPNFNTDTTVQTFISNGVSPAKLVIGIPFYGRGFQGVNTNNNGLFQNHEGASAEGSWEAGVFDFKDLRDGTQNPAYINANGFMRHWDDTAKAPYLFNPTSRVFITYDDEESVGLKAAYAAAHGFRGFMCWSMDADSEGDLLLRELHNRLYPFTAGPEIWPEIGAVFAVSWHGLTGQTYSVDFATRLVAGEWSPCTSLVTTSGADFTGQDGADQPITVGDTNFPSLGQGFYKVKRQTTNAWPE